MLKIMFKAWIGVFVIYLFAHLLITDYIRQSTSDALASNGSSSLSDLSPAAAVSAGLISPCGTL